MPSAPEVGFGGVFPCISQQLSSLYLSNQADSRTTRASFFTAVCWQFCWQSHHLADATSFAHCQNFSVAGLSRPFRAAMPKEMGFGSGVSRTNFTRLPNA